jgi:hypothetical protein
MSKWIGLAALLTGLAVLFMQCEMGLTDTEPAGLEDLSLRSDDCTPLELEQHLDLSAASLCTCLETHFDAQALSEQEREAILLMFEEEKFARDIYLALYEEWHVPIFANIAKAEQRHMEAVFCLMNKYEFQDRVGLYHREGYQNALLHQRRLQFMQQNRENVAAGFSLGATIEEMDISDLLATVVNDQIDNDDILAVFNMLMKGSRNHLRAFNRLLNNQHVRYEAHYLSEADFEAVVNSAWEAGDCICTGICPGCIGTCTGDCPNCTGTCPGCTGDCPNCTGVCPGCSGDCPYCTGTCDGPRANEGIGPVNGKAVGNMNRNTNRVRRNGKGR